MESTQHNRPSTSSNEPSTSTNKIMVLDGCFRSQIKVLAENLSKSPQSRLRVNKNSPVIAQQVHKSFLDAGANVIRTNTFRASEDYLRYNLEFNYETIKDFFNKSVENASNAVKDYTSIKKKDPKNYMVVGSCGSFTDCSELPAPKLCLSRAAYKKFHKLRAELLIAAKVDMLAFESIPIAEEAYAIVELMNELKYSQVWISFRCLKDKGDYILHCGNKLSDVARKCYNDSQPKICAVGINCVSPFSVQSALSSINDPNKHQIMIPLVAYPHIDTQSEPQWKPMVCVTTYPKRDRVPVPVQEWLNMNIRYIGGCCRVMPSNIESIRKEVDDHYNKSRF